MKFPSLIGMTLALVTGLASAQTTVNVGATASTRDAAIQEALGEALVDALGSHVFAVSTMNGDQFNSMSTSVSSGKVSDYTVVDEYETFDGVHVNLEVTLSDDSLANLAPKEIDRWSDRIAETHSLDAAQRTVGMYRGSLDDFLVGPRHQLEAGYSFVLRSYSVSAVDSDSLAGHIYVDVTPNQSWWNTYYQLVDSMTPQGSQVVLEGPIRVSNDRAGVHLGYASSVDKSLRYDLAHPLPVRVSVGDSVSRFILYKNALLVSAQPMTEDTAKTDHQISQAKRGEISLTKGNVPAGDVEVDRSKSVLSCGVKTSVSSAVYCGDRFTIKIPVEVNRESELIEKMNKGLKVELDLYGSACETDCEPDSDSADDVNQMLIDLFRKGGTT